MNYIIYLDPTNGYPSMIIKNLIGAIGINMKEESKTLKFISLRDKIAKDSDNVQLKDSLYFETTINRLKDLEFNTWMTNSEGSDWHIDLKQVMDRTL